MKPTLSLDRIALASYSFHGLQGAGTCDVFTYISKLLADTVVDLKAMNYLDHTVHAGTAHYDNSQAHWIHALLGRCPLLPTATIALETQRVQEGIYLSERLGREIAAEEIEARSVSRALVLPNL